MKKVFIRSGIRFDYVLADPDDTFFRELCTVSHQRAAEGGAGARQSDQVLHYMGKPEHAVFMQFTENIQKTQRKIWDEPVSGALSDVFPSGLYA